MLKFKSGTWWGKENIQLSCRGGGVPNNDKFDVMGQWVAALAAVVMLLGLPIKPAQAAVITDVAVTWNTIVYSHTDPFSVTTFQTNSSGGFGFAAPHVDYVLGSSVTNSTGIAIQRYVDTLTGANHLRFLDVPTAISDTHYVDFTVTPKAGVAFDPGWFALAGIQHLNGAMDYQIRTSLDGYASALTGVYWGRVHGSYRDLELDLTSLPLITEVTTFRVLFKDNDGLVGAASSTATWPYGFRIYGGVADAPITNDPPSVSEPGTIVLLALALVGIGFVRREHKAQQSLS